MNDQSRVSPVVRSDANHLAMKVARSVLDAAHDFEFTFDEATFGVAVERLPAPSWPGSGVEGLSPDTDGPWPSAIRLSCTWPKGSVVLLMEASYWRGSGQYRHLVGLRVTAAAARREVLWITLALPLRTAKDGSEAVVEASFTPFRKRDDREDPAVSRAHAARDIIARAQLPFTSDFRVEACRVTVPAASVLPSASETFERLARLAILKLPFFLREAEGVEGSLPFEVAKTATTGSIPPKPSPQMDGKRAGIWPLPGGVRHYKTTLDALLTDIAKEPMPLEALAELLRERYEVTGDTARSRSRAARARCARAPFPVAPEHLEGSIRELAASASDSAAIEARFLAIAHTPLPGVEVSWEPDCARGSLFGTVRLGARQQPFALRLQSLGERLLVRCVSPVGRVGPEESHEEILADVARRNVRIGAISATEQEHTYDLTVEEDMLLADNPASDPERVAMLLRRIADEADALEQRHLPGHDEALSSFRSQLEEEGRRGR